MNQTPMPTWQDIEKLTAYLPRLYAEGFHPVLEWEGGEYILREWKECVWRIRTETQSLPLPVLIRHALSSIGG